MLLRSYLASHRNTCCKMVTLQHKYQMSVVTMRVTMHHPVVFVKQLITKQEDKDRLYQCMNAPLQKTTKSKTETV